MCLPGLSCLPRHAAFVNLRLGLLELLHLKFASLQGPSWDVVEVRFGHFRSRDILICRLKKWYNDPVMCCTLNLQLPILPTCEESADKQSCGLFPFAPFHVLPAMTNPDIAESRSGRGQMGCNEWVHVSCLKDHATTC